METMRSIRIVLPKCSMEFRVEMKFSLPSFDDRWICFSIDDQRVSSSFLSLFFLAEKSINSSTRKLIIRFENETNVAKSITKTFVRLLNISFSPRSIFHSIWFLLESLPNVFFDKSIKTNVVCFVSFTRCELKLVCFIFGSSSLFQYWLWFFYFEFDLLSIWKLSLLLEHGFGFVGRCCHVNRHFLLN